MFGSQQSWDVLPWLTGGIATVQPFVLGLLKNSGVYYFMVIGVSVAVVLHVVRIGLKWGHLPEAANQRLPESDAPPPGVLTRPAHERHARLEREGKTVDWSAGWRSGRP